MQARADWLFVREALDLLKFSGSLSRQSQWKFQLQVTHPAPENDVSVAFATGKEKERANLAPRKAAEKESLLRALGPAPLRLTRRTTS